jgi:branched-subunit amino acid permease
VIVTDSIVSTVGAADVAGSIICPAAAGIVTRAVIGTPAMAFMAAAIVIPAAAVPRHLQKGGRAFRMVGTVISPAAMAFVRIFVIGTLPGNVKGALR